ncbi:MAG: PepSY-like domain-containing protein [Lentimicrobium sp.]|jgi:hypothetical protein|nr:PepSY-like domain-containing protein [Lentimicrobium sp.]
MKTRPLILFLFAFFAISGVSSCEKETVLPESDWPAEIKTYIETHFSDLAILQVVKDKDGTKTTYEVRLEGGFVLEFNRKMEVIEIEGLDRLPDSVIPAKILDYINQNFPANYIIEWELEGKNQEVKLDNKLEIQFDMSGEFLRIDG